MARAQRTSPIPRDIAIVGAGPIGLEAALYANALGHRPTVYERLEAGANIRRWGFLELFSPWSLNTSPLGLATLGEQGLEVPPGDHCPGGKEYCDRYLQPLAASLGGSLRTSREVLAISRAGLLKTEAIGAPERARRRFQLLVADTGGGMETARSDVVIDASGVYRNHGNLGDGGIPAPGEEALSEKITYHIPDLLGADRPLYAGRTTLLVGAGYSAATVLESFAKLMETEPRTRLVWARRDNRREPLDLYENDPLPQRDRLAREANRFATDPPEGCDVLSGFVTAGLERTGERVAVRLISASETSTVEVDRIVSMTGYRPDTGFHRELQVHLCYATEGPMKLAAALLGSGSSGDCLERKELTGETLLNPEPGYYIAGHKSYGRRSDFLLRTGIEQVRDIFRLIEEDESLDLYDETESP